MFASKFLIISDMISVISFLVQLSGFNIFELHIDPLKIPKNSRTL